MKALTLFLILFVVCLTSCSEPSQLEGAWLGEGTFSVSAGSKKVKAQLEILSDGTYRFLILEPRILMITGMEKGTWSREGALLTLSPVNEKMKRDDSKKSVFSNLRKSSPAKLRVKQLTLVDGLSSMTLSDGPLELKFTPNVKATRKLEEAGEVSMK